MVFLLSLPGVSAEREPFRIAIMLESGGARTFFYKLVKQFESMHPQLEVKLWVFNDGGYKAEIERLLLSNQGPDVVHWHAGGSLKHFVDRDLIEPIDVTWQQEGWDSAFSPSIKRIVSFESQVYALPYSYYALGFYYRKSVFAKYNLEPPNNWQEFQIVCDTLKNNNIAPIAIGTKHEWTTGSWFDYLNLRINGLQFHRELMEGKASFTDTRVVKIFEIWKEILEKNYFNKNRNDLHWRESIHYVYRGLAGMTLIGNFATANLYSTLSEDIGFFKFPVMDEAVGHFEEAPIDVLMVPKKSRNKERAKDFLKLVASEHVMASLNDSLGAVSPHLKSPPSKRPLAHHGVKLLESAEGFSQYFDRDTNTEFSALGFRSLVKFMTKPDVEIVVTELEAARLKFLKTGP